jgi:hypothetical protein
MDIRLNKFDNKKPYTISEFMSYLLVGQRSGFISPTELIVSSLYFSEIL